MKSGMTIRVTTRKELKNCRKRWKICRERYMALNRFKKKKPTIKMIGIEQKIAMLSLVQTMKHQSSVVGYENYTV